MGTKDFLQKMKKADYIAVWFSVESGSQNITERMGKSISIIQTRKAFK
jgi:hypothetical protein